MPWTATHYHAQLGLPDKGRANKGLVVCYAGSMIYEIGVWISARCLVLRLVVVRMAMPPTLLLLSLLQLFINNINTAMLYMSPKS